MKLEFSGKNVTVTDALRSKVETKMAKIEKFTGKMISAHISLEVERRVHHAELTVHCAHDRIYKGKGMADDMYMAINEAADAVERQGKKEKGKRLAGRSKKAKEEGGDEDAEEDSSPASRGRILRRPELFLAKPTTLEEAALLMRDRRRPVVVFRETQSGHLLVLYREGGNLGLVEALGRG